MKYIYKEFKYQLEAVKAIIDVFEGQPYHDNIKYIRDLGTANSEYQLDLFNNDDTGFNNADIILSPEQILKNINNIQSHNNIKLSEKLIGNLGNCSLDVEMETGTGKTFVYTKTMFELNKQYGWSKFIIVVPSIAIREGVNQSIKNTADCFQEQYGKKIIPMVYSSSNLTQLDDFSSSADIKVLIINTQAFNASLKEGGKSKEARIIFSERDEFGSRRPIDVIAANHPIIILDEPQKMGGDKTQKALGLFKPLFVLNYSATHVQKHNLVYRLDALDAYNQKLVKKIEVKGFKINNLKGVDAYLYLNDIIVTPEGPKARMEFEQKLKTSPTPKRVYMMLDSKRKSDLYALSGEMEQYKGYTISEVNYEIGKVSFLNGVELSINQVQGDVSEQDLRRIQIHETIKSHMEKERENFRYGIKTLSLFFIDEVAKYRQYDEDGNELLGEYGQIFEEEYQEVLAEQRDLFDDPAYSKYLDEYCNNPSEAHRGYFSIDKKSHRMKDTSNKESEEDMSAYDEIIKNKEYLMSFESKTRFIFSHSALREGWDNPNVFQICTLKHTDNTTSKRQEIGRGLRICVNKDLVRQDIQTIGDRVHKINVLTVIANDSYNEFATDLQKEINSNLGDRPTKVSIDYFVGKLLHNEASTIPITEIEATMIYHYLITSRYVDFDNQLTKNYYDDAANNTLAPLPDELIPYTEDITNYINAIHNPSAVSAMIEDANKPKIISNGLNDNFEKFKDFWNKINHKYSYTVEFDSDELISNSIQQINNTLFVSKLMYTITTGIQKDKMKDKDLKEGKAFTISESDQLTLNKVHKSNVKYDLLGKIAQGATITRKSAAAILKGINFEKLEMFSLNPEEFISKVVDIIKEQKSTLIVSHITYNQIEGIYDENEIFTSSSINQFSDKTFVSNKAITNYITTDGAGDNSIEMDFVKSLDTNNAICTYAKMPKGGYVIPTPVGNYSPDWAIVFEKGTVKHMFFVAETKGSMSSMQLRKIEENKISCAETLFKNMFKDEEVVYHKVDNFNNLLSLAGFYK